MKKLNVTMFAMFLAMGSSYGAVTVNVKNFTSLSAGLPVLNEEGTGFLATGANGSIAVGSLAAVNTTFDFTGATATTIKAAFSQFGTFSNVTPGLFSGTVTANPALAPNDTSFTNFYIYTLVGNKSTIADSDMLAVFYSTAKFPVVNGAGNGATTTNNTTTDSTLVFGSLVNLTSQPTGTSTFAKGVVMAVPEPSAALLGAFGVLGLLRRRRN